MRNLWPNFFIVGAARTGTTSLHEYLNEVEGICMSRIKEPNFFLDDMGPIYRHLPYIREDKRYLSLFQPKNGETISGESSVSYLYDSKAPGLIYARIPEAKIVIILRDPVVRAYSHFLHHLHFGFETNFDFLESIKKDFYQQGKKGWGYTRLYVELGMYSRQIQRYLDLFGRNRVKIIIYEDEFKPKTKETVQDVISFLGLRSTISDKIIQKIFNSSTELSSGSFVVPRIRAIPIMSKLARNIRGNNSVVTAITYPITSAVRKNFLFKSSKQPPLTERAARFLEDIYRDDVLELPGIIQKVPSWTAKYGNHRFSA